MVPVKTFNHMYGGFYRFKQGGTAGEALAYTMDLVTGSVRCRPAEKRAEPFLDFAKK